jgi:hypothetical protein
MPLLNSDCRSWIDRIDESTSPGQAKLADLVHSAPLPPLDGGPIQKTLRDWMNQHPNVWEQLNRGELLESGLWLLVGDLDRSHDISQQDSTAEGSFLHGIMHRREGDFSNAKYWFRKVGTHCVIDQLASKHDQYASAAHFVDACESGKNSDSLKEIAWDEWQSLMSRIASA